MYRVYLLDSDAHTCERVFTVDFDTPEVALTEAKRAFKDAGIRVVVPLALDIRKVEAPVFSMAKRIEEEQPKSRAMLWNRTLGAPGDRLAYIEHLIMRETV